MSFHRRLAYENRFSNRDGHISVSVEGDLFFDFRYYKTTKREDGQQLPLQKKGNASHPLPLSKKGEDIIEEKKKSVDGHPSRL